jgi:hypothetical protein
MNKINTEKLKQELETRREYWRTLADDSHGINMAVYVALLEVSAAFEKSLEYEQC